MVQTRTMSNDDPVTPPPPLQDDRPVIAKLLFPVPPHSAETAPLSSLMQREHDHSRKTQSRRIVNISDYTRIRLHRRIQKIYEMSTDVVEGYSTFYFDKHGKRLPQETVCFYIIIGLSVVAMKLGLPSKKRSSGILRAQTLMFTLFRILEKNQRNMIPMTLIFTATWMMMLMT